MPSVRDSMTPLFIKFIIFDVAIREDSHIFFY